MPQSKAPFTAICAMEESFREGVGRGRGRDLALYNTGVHNVSTVVYQMTARPMRAQEKPSSLQMAFILSHLLQTSNNAPNPLYYLFGFYWPKSTVRSTHSFQCEIPTEVNSYHRCSVFIFVKLSCYFNSAVFKKICLRAKVE